MEKWRAAKAQKQAEVEQLNGKLRRLCAAVENETSAAEAKIRESQDEHEAALRAARQSVEQAVKAEYDPKIAEAQQQLCAARKEEADLRELLKEKSGDGGGAAGTAKDVVKTALTAAVSAVLRRLDDVFDSEEAEGLKMDEWRSELQSLVQREIQTSFAVGVESETQAERMEYARFFDDMLAFWRSAEDQERERLLKMDESLLADMQAMTQQELKRLQDEALGMERVYIESREAWAAEHQRLLQRELEATLQRREAELQEQRRQRHSLHIERLRDAEVRHKDAMAKEEALHQKQMEQLQAYFAREEDLRAEQQRIQAAAQEDVTKSTALLRDIMATAEDAAAAVKAYEAAVDESRRGVEVEREGHFKEQTEMLERLQQLAATQCSNTEAERAALEDCASQLRLASQNLDRHLQDESAWLAQQETTYKRSKDEWEREYRRWQHLVQQERQAAEERFHEALLALQQSLGLLETEERELAVETAAMHRGFGDMEALAQREIELLRRRAADVQSRSVAIADVQAQLSQKKAAVAEAKQQLVLAQQRLEDEQAELRLDEERLRDMMEAVRVARSQTALRYYNMELLRAADAQRRRQPPESVATTAIDSDRRPPIRDEGRGSARCPASGGVAKGNRAALRDAASAKNGRQHRDPHRLPNKVLQELQEQLSALMTATGGGVGRDVFVSTMRWLDPALPCAMAAQRTRQTHPRRREAADDTFATDVPAPLSSPPLPGRQRQTRSKVHIRARPAASPQRGRHADPSSLPLTSDNLSQLSLRSDDEWSPSGNTFTNLIGLSDLDTTSQSIR
ncbi:conserved hypothetical protein [Leishmania infantum JPCM5]|uniref:Uncharacterized protein n=2 Tax=Leishmania infantum TaxID=5671 RepID=A4IBL5_LEIIN|nr:conserved hypothetical protein [Leishmania infantum JPCM5]CAC9545744.1 hypothetical_protein_-_conserved [Leishmania infantum]CAM72234.1 conserved hypothetical protein [Leishmania infantum JPCM5]SUZ46154.1 hypothetical_protein_-_conserved [Leishmania infantum]|eukprot:XP_001469134.1 conserved hypothetical protein [Leishmania infantum JPCM5]